jgi:diguanylate cyclase (GGDEF)-like protein
MNEISSRSLTVAYSLALAIVAALSLLSHVTLNGILREEEGSAAIIGISARQTMLSQRIAFLASRYAAGEADVAPLLSGATDEFETFQKALAHGSIERNIPPPTSPALVDLYIGEGDGLDTLAARFVARARLITGIEPNEPDFKTQLTPLLADATGPLLTKLEAVVRFHQQASDSQMLKLRLLQSGSLIIVLLTLVAEAMGIFRPMVARVQKYTSELLRLANRDPLTGVLNRKGFNDHAHTELARASRYRRPTSLLMIDADDFKSVNDRFGHSVGDEVLKAIASAVGASLRPADILCRLGGEEFGVMLPETELAGATAAAERIRRRVEDTRVTTPAGIVKFTISVGATQLERTALSPKAAMERADAALYQAKAEGRNRVVSVPAPAIVEVVLTAAA